LASRLVLRIVRCFRLEAFCTLMLIIVFMSFALRASLKCQQKMDVDEGAALAMKELEACHQVKGVEE